MKCVVTFIALLIAPLAVAVAQAQGGQTLASTLDVYVFPAKGQAADQQSQDEVECYEWATANTGVDPFDIDRQMAESQQQTEYEKQQAEQSRQGKGAQGAVRGAAAGALIGEIADDDAGKGAAYGAAAGAIRGRRQAYRASEQQKAEAEQRGQEREQATQQQLQNFKNAFSVCLEAKEYMVKY